MNLKTARIVLAHVGLTIRKTDNDEYRVNYRGKSERYAYYASDLQDAVQTGLRMAEQPTAELKPDLRIGRSE
jgi:hypothetical protein